MEPTRVSCYSVVDEKNRKIPVKIQGKSVGCLLDLNSETSFLRLDLLREIFDSLKDDQLEEIYNIVARGRIVMNVKINDEVFPVDFKIVRVSRIDEKIQFGRDVLDRVNIFLKNGGVAQILSKDKNVVVQNRVVFRLVTRYIGVLLSLMTHVYEDTKIKTYEIVSCLVMKLKKLMTGREELNESTNSMEKR